MKALNAEAGRYQAQADQAKGSTKGLTDGLKGLADAADRAQQKYDDLEGSLSQDQAYIDLANQIDAVTTAGDDAIKAQQDANEAIKKNAKDATEKQREAEQAMRDYQSAIISTKGDIIELARTAGANPVELAAALKKVDEGDLAGAKADAEAWSRRNPVQVSFSVSKLGAALAAAAAGQKVTVAGTSVDTAPGQTVVNVNVPRGYREMDAAVAGRRLARRSGQMYARR